MVKEMKRDGRLTRITDGGMKRIIKYMDEVRTKMEAFIRDELMRLMLKSGNAHSRPNPMDILVVIELLLLPQVGVWDSEDMQRGMQLAWQLGMLFKGANLYRDKMGGFDKSLKAVVDYEEKRI